MSKPAKSRQFCANCRDNFYNSNNSLGVKECWNFQDAKVVKKLPIGVWQPPPYSLKAQDREWVLNCTRPSGVVYIDPPKVLDSQGYWKR